MRLGATPVPIPNTMVKPEAADGTTLETMWESRWLPGSFGSEFFAPTERTLKTEHISYSKCVKRKIGRHQECFVARRRYGDAANDRLIKSQMVLLTKQNGRRADALALRADEGRDKLRKASGRRK